MRIWKDLKRLSYNKGLNVFRQHVLGNVVMVLLCFVHKGFMVVSLQNKKRETRSLA